MQTLETTPESLTRIINDIQRHSDRLIHLFSFVPDDKLNWTPSSTSRSALRLVAHTALANTFFANVISGNMPEPLPSPEEFSASMRDAETKVATREAAVALLRETTPIICAAIAGVKEEDLGSSCNSPFGELPMQFWLGMSSHHVATHGCQLEYLQTIWGDLDNHFG
jgi:hypothetical protein